MMVVLPAPVWPTMAAVSPGAMVKETPRRIHSMPASGPEVNAVAGSCEELASELFTLPPIHPTSEAGGDPGMSRWDCDMDGASELTRPFKCSRCSWGRGWEIGRAHV